MQKMSSTAAGAAICALLALGAGGAQATALDKARAEGWAYSKCFDKALLRYVDCPGLEDAPEPAFKGSDAAKAEESWTRGVYLGLIGGVSFPEDTDLTVNGAALETGYELGFAVGALAGYEFDDVAPGIGLRTELELGYMSAEADEHTLGGAGLDDPQGDVEALYAFANLYGDIALTQRLDLVLGGGLGLGEVRFEGFEGGGTRVMDDEALAFGYHLDIGLAYAATQRWTVSGAYRYVSFLAEDLSFSAPGVASSGDPDVSAHQALATLRYGF